MYEISVLQSLFVLVFHTNISIVPLQLEFLGIIENLETLLIGIFSVMLLLLSVSSYKKTGFSNILYASAAFGLFAFDVFLELIIERYYSFNYPMQDLVHTSITLAILALFFISIIKKTR